MKEKLIALITVSTMAVSLLLTSGYLAWRQMEEGFSDAASPEMGVSRKSDGSVTGSVPNVDPEIQKIVKKLGSNLKGLRTPGLPQRERVDFEMLGYDLSKFKTPQSDSEGDQDDYSLASHQRQIVSMIYVSGNSRYAVVNGKLFKEGDMLNKELQLKTITAQKVLIVSKASSKWVKPFNPPGGKEERAESTSTTATEKKIADKSTKSKPKSPMDQITQGMEAIKNYSETLKALEAVE